MSLNSTLKKKPMSAVATLDLNLSAQHSLQNAKADEKIHAGSGNGANAVSGAELWAARIGFFAGGFTVASWAPLIPFVQSQLRLEPYVLGLLLLGLGVGSFVGMRYCFPVWRPAFCWWCFRLCRDFTLSAPHFWLTA